MVNRYPDFKIPSTVDFLNEVVTELPHNCLYDKVLTGAGATTIVIENKEHYVICVPYVSLIENKCFQHKNVFGVYEKTKIKDLKNYLADGTIPVKKIMVTYDSLPKLMLSINPLEYKLLIDEVHCLFKSYSFRNKACRNVLENYTKFKSYCFMTATMLEKEFTIKELSHLPVYQADWERIKEVTVHSYKCEKNVIHTVAHLVNSFKEGKEVGNAHIFVNSVNFIKLLIEHCKLDDTNCRAIWSTHNNTKVDIKRSSINDGIKKINLYTSCNFEGCDIYDSVGKTYIVSDGTRVNSLLDISTSFKQICGRLRKTDYWDTVHHIYTTTRYEANVTYEEFRQSTLEEVEKCKAKITQLNNLTPDLKADIIRLFSKELTGGLYSYISSYKNEFTFDENLVKLDLYNYKVTKCMYKLRINLSKEYADIGLKVTEYDIGEYSKENQVKIVNNVDNFKEAIDAIIEGDSVKIQSAYTQYSFLHDAVIHIGVEKIIELNYNATNIKRHTNNKKFANSEYDRIKAELKMHYKITDGIFLNLKEIKTIIQKAYDINNVKLSAKATDIEKYFKVKKIGKRFDTEDASWYENGYNLLSTK